jgi:hypothetical protein
MRTTAQPALAARGAAHCADRDRQASRGPVRAAAGTPARPPRVPDTVTEPPGHELPVTAAYQPCGADQLAAAGDRATRHRRQKAASDDYRWLGPDGNCRVHARERAGRGQRHPADRNGQPPELARLRAVWGGMYSITCLDGVWSAYYIRTGEEFGARSLPVLGAMIRRDYGRRVEIRPGAPERMST